MMRRQKKRFPLKEKVFRIQESVISEKLATKDLKATFNLILSFAIYSILLNVIYYCTNSGEFQKEFIFVISKFQHIEILIMQEIIYFAILFFVFYPLTKFWCRLRTKFSSISTYLDIGFAFTIISSIGLFFLASLYVILLYDINAVMTIAIVTEKIRMAMKTQAFILENKRKQETSIEKENKDAKFSTYRQLLFFMFAPTLVYRDEYPRLEKRDYKLLAKLSLQFWLCIYFLMILVFRVFIPTFEKIGAEPIDGKVFIKNLSVVYVASSALCFLVFYSFLHLYTNICSQIFLFGDRRWYDDWWSCTDFSTYYRKWNLLVHDWIHAYLYTPFVHIFRGKRVLAGALSIYISSVVHEYILAVSLRHINPILSIMFGGFGVFLFVINGLKSMKNYAVGEGIKKMDKKITNHLKEETDYGSLRFTVGNTLFFFAIFNGWFIMISIYAIGYFSKQNCIKDNSSWFVSFVHQWQCIDIKF